MPPSRYRLLLLALLAGLVGLSSAAQAQIAGTISYQGYLTGAEGAPVEHGGATLVFRLHDAETAGDVVWSETQTGVPVVDGLFAVQLGASEALAPSMLDAPLWLSVTYEGAELAPRTPLTAAPYSLRARSLDEAALQAGTNITITRTGDALRIDAAEGAEPPPPAWNLDGNAGTTSDHFLGTTDDRPLELRAGGEPMLRLDPETGVAIERELTVSALVTSSEGGFRFPDGTIQTTAAEGGGSDGWSLTGNAGTTSEHFLGTTDAQPLELRIANARVWRAAPATHASQGTSPTLLAGSPHNSIAEGIVGAVVLGGGRDGSPNVAAGNYATVLGGLGNTAIGVASIAGGQGATSPGNYALALGNNAVASAGFAIAIGNDATATALNTTAIGNNAVAGTNFATAIGRNVTATGNGSIALGNSNTANGNNSMAVGFASTALGTSSAATGHFTSAPGNYSVTMGERTVSQASHSVAIGRYNIPSGTPNAWNADEPLLVAGNGTSDAARSNAFALYKNGDLTIAGTLTQSSDERLKTDVRPMEHALEAVLGLRPVRYAFRPDANRAEGEQLGLIAQDVRAVLPELVREEADGYLSVSYATLSAVLAGAVQELSARIERLEAENEALRAVAAEAASVQARLAAQEAGLEALLARLNLAPGGAATTAQRYP